MDVPFHWMKYFNIPSVIAWDERLKHIDGYTFAIVHMLDNKEGCFISNKMLSTMLGRNGQSASNSVGRLVKAGYFRTNIEVIKTEEGNRTKRTLRINHTYLQAQRRLMEEGGGDNFRAIKKLIGQEIWTIKKLIAEDNILSSKEDNNNEGLQEDPSLA